MSGQSNDNSQPNQQLTDLLNTQIANWCVMFIKLHNFHWYVKGPHFFTLHAKFEEFYKQAAQHIDDLAERLLALGGKPVATMKEFAQSATIQEATGNEIPEQMVKSLIDDFSTMISELKDGIQTAAEQSDETTGDMLLSIHTTLEKHVWMMNAFNSKQ